MFDNAADPAFPSEGCNGWGATKRELFAAMAMVGLLAGPGRGSANNCGGLAALAVVQADALLAALDKPVSALLAVLEKPQTTEPEADAD